jgi:glucuronosyltransferase
MFKDRPMSPDMLVKYWTEYVIKHNGTEHINPASNDMSWYQYHQLDVILVIILVSISLLIIVLYTLIIIKCSIVKCFHLKQIKTE